MTLVLLAKCRKDHNWNKLLDKKLKLVPNRIKDWIKTIRILYFQQYRRLGATSEGWYLKGAKIVNENRMEKVSRVFGKNKVTLIYEMSGNVEYFGYDNRLSLLKGYTGNGLLKEMNISCDEDGNLIKGASKYWLNNKKHGRWACYKLDCGLPIKRVQNWDRGKKCGTSLYYDNNVLVKKEEWLNGKKHGTFSYYDDIFEIILKEVEWVNDKKILIKTYFAGELEKIKKC